MSKKIIYGSSFLSCPIEAVNFIAAVESAMGLSMDSIQRDGVCGFLSRLEGKFTTNGSNLLSLLKARGSKIWTLTPINDTTASAAGYGIELLSASALGTFNNFVSGDFTPNGVIGGATKFFNTGAQDVDYPQDDSAHYTYCRTEAGALEVLFGSFLSPSGTAYVNRGATNNREIIRYNSSGFVMTDTIFPSTGFIGIERSSSTSVRSVRNGSTLNSYSLSSTTPLSQDIYFHSNNNAGASSTNTTKQLSMYVVGCPILSTNELADFNEAVQWYQTNIITGGRNV